MAKKYKTDWLASDPVFYNTDTSDVSNNINDVISYDKIEIHPEGLNNYLDFGYSVFGQTPIKNVKFLGHSQEIYRGSDGDLVIEDSEDPFLKWIGKNTKESDVIERIKSKIRSWELEKDEVMIPLSGGFDSRMISALLEQTHKAEAFTYGLSEDQSESKEVVYAEIISNELKINWRQVEIGNFHKYFDEWHSLYGVSTHAHGMYQLEFYRKTRNILGKNGPTPLLSGIIGDVWAGGVNVPEIKSPEDIYRLGYTHGLCADSRYSQLEDQGRLRTKYFETHREYLKNPRFRIVEAMRRKMILLSYLFRVPRYFSFSPWSPFLDVDIAGAMLSIPDHRKEKRKWQRDFFRGRDIYPEELNVDASPQNNLNAQAMRRLPPPPLDTELLERIVQPDYVRWVNRKVGQQGDLWDFFWGLLDIPKIGGLMRRVGLKDQRLEAYRAYLTLRPLETLLKRSHSHQEV
ncbi:hypothetical protein GGQ10_000927 [Salinibacter ruber]|uniref:asparagine synthase C-terminal domain-containing protein n=1 Tax=Salinibacter ruber TaxID=146919 RepID=UPI002167203C|nr:asparagine synthase C-terminal domain-containing protein [Salinibacter ruber]MCS4086128.1 hypothetical protein [Salinibacter ruber]